MPVNDLAEVLGVAVRTIQRMAKDGMPQAARGQYDVRDCVKWWVARISEESEPDAGLTPRDELAIAQRIRVELETEQLRGTLLPRDLVTRAFNQVAALVASQLDGLGPRLAGELADMTDPQQVQSTLLREARATRAAIAQTMREFGQSVETGDAFDDEEEDAA